MIPKHSAWPGLQEAEDRNGRDQRSDHDLEPPGLRERTDRDQDLRRQRELGMELVEERDEVRQYDHDQHSTDSDCECEDDRGVDHCASDLLDRRVLALQVDRDLEEHAIQASAVLRRPHHVHVQLAEHVRVMGDRHRERFTVVEIGVDVVQSGLEGTRPGAAAQQPDGLGDGHADLQECRELAREEDQVAGGDAEERRHLAVDPLPTPSRRPHRDHAIPFACQVAVHGGGRRSVCELVLEHPSRSVGAVLELDGSASDYRM